MGDLTRRGFLVGTAGAIAASIASPASAKAPSIRERFAGMPDGPTSNSLTDFPASGAGEPWVRNGFMSARYPQQFEGGSYRIAYLDGPVRTVGAQFALTTHTIGGGLLCLSIQMGNLAETSPAVPVSPMHLWLDRYGWNMDVNTEAGTPVDYVASGSFRAPLADDGRTLYAVQATLNRSAEQCVIALPDGQVITLTDYRFNRGGRYVYVEPFKTPGNSGLKSAALVREWWATT